MTNSWGNQGGPQSPWPQQAPGGKSRSGLMIAGVVAILLIVGGVEVLLGVKSGSESDTGLASAASASRTLEPVSSPGRSTTSSAPATTTAGPSGASSSGTTPSGTSTSGTSTTPRVPDEQLYLASSNFADYIEQRDWDALAERSCAGLDTVFEATGFKDFVENHEMHVGYGTAEGSIADGYELGFGFAFDDLRLSGSPEMPITATLLDHFWNFCADEQAVQGLVDSLTTLAAESGTGSQPPPPGTTGWMPTVDIEIAAKAAVFDPMVNALNTGVWAGSGIQVASSSPKTEVEIAVYASSQVGVRTFELTFTESQPAAETESGANVVIGTLAYKNVGSKLFSGGVTVGAVQAAGDSTWYLVVLADAW